ncbi:MAG: NADH-quinone oxidoreductase subunit J [Bacteroidales bacterium]
MFSTLLFYLLSVILVFSALMVIFSRKPVNSVLFLIVSFFAISGHYILLNAQFLAVVNIIVYAGAIMVLFLFTVMLLNLNKETEPRKPAMMKVVSVITGCLLAVTLIGSLKGLDNTAFDFSSNTIGLIKNLGKILFKDFLIPFELTSVLFLASIVGTIMIGKKE